MREGICQCRRSAQGVHVGELGRFASNRLAGVPPTRRPAVWTAETIGSTADAVEAIPPMRLPRNAIITLRDLAGHGLKAAIVLSVAALPPLLDPLRLTGAIGRPGLSSRPSAQEALGGDNPVE